LVDSEVRAQMLSPVPATSSLPGIGGLIKQRFEDFVVDEVAAYPPDGREGRHLFLRIRKRGVSTPDLIRNLSHALRIESREVGCAGRKDREAVTTQWLSVPYESRAGIDRLKLEGVEVIEARPHGQKLRMGHLRGNRFRIVIRDPGMDLESARHLVREKVLAMERGGGLENLYGEQRFGHGGENLDRGLDLLRAGRRPNPTEKFLLSAAQSGLFNLYVVLRRGQGWLRQALPGDLLQKRDGGALFAVDDVAVEQPRLTRGELVVSGPIFGAKMRAPDDPSPASLLEQEVLRRADVPAELFGAFGKNLPGSRRPVQVSLSDFRLTEIEPDDELAGGLELRFGLPAGSYATQLIRELQSGT
jgi:tRNA pseudouridine13 synthase